MYRYAGDVVGAPVGVFGEAALAAFDLAFSVNGTLVRRSLGASWDMPFEAVNPVREFSWRKDGHGFAGWYYSSTMRDHVGYESWLEQDRLILLDRDSHVVAIASQPFWLHWRDGTRRRRHAPDYFVRLSDGGARIIDVRAADELDELTEEAFDATGHACRAVGWEFEWAGWPEPVFMANVRWLSRYRRARCARPAPVAARLLEVFREPRGLWDGAGLVRDRLQVLPVLFHLLWSGALRTDLVGGLMGTDSLVWTEGNAWAA
ncbi:TnsA-like heteromeric transposase endonuclease subunit [Streptomyces sp. NPDC059479]|uniref:TnsA-like heteromeric transposase endonuclease subunit n=1 Tax=Streptomyces sp. NPDC059479 TaxID=3346848 RepID=UPI00367BE413